MAQRQELTAAEKLVRSVSTVKLASRMVTVYQASATAKPPCADLKRLQSHAQTASWMLARLVSIAGVSDVLVLMLCVTVALRALATSTVGAESVLRRHPVLCASAAPMGPETGRKLQSTAAVWIAISAQMDFHAVSLRTAAAVCVKTLCVYHATTAF